VKPAWVLDSWIVLAWLKDQHPGADRMESLWQDLSQKEAQLYMNIVNVGEVLYLSAKAKDAEYAEQVVDDLIRRGVSIVPASNRLVLEAARLKARFPISYGDAFAAATALNRSMPIVTGDPDFKKLAVGTDLQISWANVAA